MYALLKKASPAGIQDVSGSGVSILRSLFLLNITSEKQYSDSELSMAGRTSCLAIMDVVQSFVSYLRILGQQHVISHALFALQMTELSPKTCTKTIAGRMCLQLSEGRFHQHPASTEACVLSPETAGRRFQQPLNKGYGALGGRFTCAWP